MHIVLWYMALPAAHFSIGNIKGVNLYLCIWICNFFLLACFGHAYKHKDNRTSTWCGRRYITSLSFRTHRHIHFLIKSLHNCFSIRQRPKVPPFKSPKKRFQFRARSAIHGNRTDSKKKKKKANKTCI